MTLLISSSNWTSLDILPVKSPQDEPLFLPLLNTLAPIHETLIAQSIYRGWTSCPKYLSWFMYTEIYQEGSFNSL